jgi:L-lactate dehydrogenase
MKLGVIGAGAVGAACLLASVMRGCAREIVVVNRDRKRAQGVVTDLRYGAVQALQRSADALRSAVKRTL